MSNHPLRFVEFDFQIQHGRGFVDSILTFADIEAVAEILQTIEFYDSLSNIFRIAFPGFHRFVSRLDAAERFDEAHLLPASHCDAPANTATAAVPRFPMFVP